MKLSFPAFQQLRWKLTFSYVLFTPLVMLVIEVFIVIVVFVVIELFFVPQLVLSGLQQYQGQLKPFFAHDGVPDQKALAVWIKTPSGFPAGYQPDFRAVVDGRGQVVASIGSKALPSGVMLQTSLPAQSAANLQQVLTGKAGDRGLMSQSPDGGVIAIVPIKGEDNKVHGALIDDTGPNLYTQETRYWLEFDILYVLFFLAVYSFFSIIVGMMSGFFAARNITRRFSKLALAADNWSRGDFSTFIQDSSADEIGQLARKLNRMAEQLQNQLRIHQRLAILEERNRLARDLHDSVKQHIFVIALQVGTAKLRLGESVNEVQEHLTEAERVLLQVQQELKTLVRELRPTALEGKGLGVALQALVAQWMRQANIRASVLIEGEQALPLVVEEALFRVAQEALSNVARHSRAATIQVHLRFEQDVVTLSFEDDGQGFDATAMDGDGVGLLSMRERMNALGGDMHIESFPGKGTRVIAHCKRQIVEVHVEV
jgi:signal transduction histidine kinase